MMVFATLLTSIAGCPSTTTEPDVDPSDEGASTGTVTVRIVSEAKAPTVIQVPDVADGTSLETVMRSLQEADIAISGSGTTAFVNSIQGKATSADKGWTFTVDGEHANQGIGQTVLHPPVEVEWSYGSFADSFR